MPIVSLLDLEQSLKLNQMLIDTNLNGSTNINNTNLNLLLKNANNSNNTSTSPSTTNSALLANALIQQIQQQNKFFNNNIILNCIKSNLAANLNTSLNSTNSDNPKQINYSRYKTELCRQYSENGECKYGDKCQFAHGFNDLKDVNRHPKYKTDYCKTFHSKGFCPYGPRCHFIHEFYEKNENETTVVKSKEKTVKINNKKESNDYSPIDKQLEALQAQLTSSLFSTITEETTVNTLDENSLNEQHDMIADKTEKLTDPLDEFNQSLSSFGCSTGSFSPVILSSSSSSSSASVSSSTSPTLTANNRMFVKKKLQQLANLTNNNSLYDNECVSDVFSTNPTINTTNDQTKLSKHLLEAAFLNKSINLTSPTGTCDEDLYTLLNQVKLHSPPSPGQMRTRSSTSSTSSSTSMSSSSSTMSSCDYFDRLQSPIKQSQRNTFLNINDLKLYALANQVDPQIDMISIKLNNSKETSLQGAKTNKPRHLGPIGKPTITESNFDSSLLNQQQILANINSLIMNQKNVSISSDLLYKNSLNNQQINW